MIATILIIAVTCLISFLAFNNSRLLDRLLLWPPGITRNHQYDRFVTHGFVHADPMHLLFNMFTLYWSGRALESTLFGPLVFGAFYLGAIVVAILPSYFANRTNSRYRSLGASGAVTAAMFGYILLAPWSKIIIFVLPVPAILYAVAFVVYSIYMEKQQTDYVNRSAHLWGAAYGVVFTILYEPRVTGFFLQQLAQPQF